MKYVLAMMILVLTSSAAFADMRQYRSPVVQYFIDHPEVNSVVLVACVARDSYTREKACKKTETTEYRITRAQLFDEDHYWSTDVLKFGTVTRPPNMIIYHVANDDKVTSGYFVRIDGASVKFIHLFEPSETDSARTSTNGDFDENLLGVYDFDNCKPDAEPHRKFFSKLVPEKVSKGSMRVSHK